MSNVSLTTSFVFTRSKRQYVIHGLFRELQGEDQSTLRKNTLIARGNLKKNKKFKYYKSETIVNNKLIQFIKKMFVKKKIKIVLYCLFQRPAATVVAWSSRARVTKSTQGVVLGDGNL